MKFHPKEFCVIPNCFSGHEVVESLQLNIDFDFTHLQSCAKFNHSCSKIIKDHIGKKKKTYRKLPLARCVLFTFKHVYHLQKHKIIKSS